MSVPHRPREITTDRIEALSTTIDAVAAVLTHVWDGLAEI